jgi:F420H(2)-dependent quinone reductase
MRERPGYRRGVARAYVRLFRPLEPRGPRRSWLDRLTARWWTRLDVIVFRHSGMSIGVRALGVKDVLMLRTRGRVSGQVREVLVAFVTIDGVPHICAANGGSDHAPAWLKNLEIGEPVEIEWHRRRETVVPSLLDGSERERVFSAVYTAFPHVRLYLSHTTRCFPIVRLDPIECESAASSVPARAVGESLRLAGGAQHHQVA